MTINSTSSIRNLSDVIRGLSEASGKSIPVVIDNEMGRILEKCVSLTPAATESKIVANALDRQWGTHSTKFQPKRPFRGNSPAAGFKKYKYSNRYPDALWEEISNQRLASIERRIGHMNLSKQSWLKLAEMLGLEIKATTKVRKMPQNFNQNFNVTRSGGTEGEYFVSILNAQPTINRIGGKGIVKKAIAGRVGYFQKNLETGAMESLAALAKSYPGLKINSAGGALA